MSVDSLSAARVPFLDLGRSVKDQDAELSEAATRVLRSGQFILGQEVACFEQEYSAWLGGQLVVGVASGTDAVELALRAVDVGPGDEVVTQANTCVPTVAAIERTGATPVLCDVDVEAGTMDPESLSNALGKKTRAVIPVHLYGQCADIDAIAALVGDIPIIEDCAQAHGAKLRGRQAGTMGRLAAYSFYPTKNLGALGDGGAVVTSDPELAHRVRLLRHYGQEGSYNHLLKGVNSRLDEFQAALLRVRLRALDAKNRRRRDIAASYTSVLDKDVLPLTQLPERHHVFHLFVCRTDRRERLRRALDEQGIDTLIHYPQPIHKCRAYRELANGPVPLRNAEMLSEQIVSLPIFPELTEDEVQAVASALAETNLLG